MRVLVPSLSEQGKFYPVQVLANGDLHCDCPRYLTSPRGAKMCRHVGLVRQADAILDKCAQSHGLQMEPMLCRQCLVALLAVTAGRVKRDYVTKTESKEKVAAARKRRATKRKAKGGADGET